MLFVMAAAARQDCSCWSATPERRALDLQPRTMPLTCGGQLSFITRCVRVAESIAAREMQDARLKMMVHNPEGEDAMWACCSERRLRYCQDRRLMVRDL